MKASFCGSCPATLTGCIRESGRFLSSWPILRRKAGLVLFNIESQTQSDPFCMINAGQMRHIQNSWRAKTSPSYHRHIYESCSTYSKPHHTIYIYMNKYKHTYINNDMPTTSFLKLTYPTLSLWSAWAVFLVTCRGSGLCGRVLFSSSLRLLTRAWILYKQLSQLWYVYTKFWQKRKKKFVLHNKRAKRHRSEGSWR